MTHGFIYFLQIYYWVLLQVVVHSCSGAPLDQGRGLMICTKAFCRKLLHDKGKVNLINIIPLHVIYTKPSWNYRMFSLTAQMLCYSHKECKKGLWGGETHKLRWKTRKYQWKYLKEPITWFLTDVMSIEACVSGMLYLGNYVFMSIKLLITIQQKTKMKIMCSVDDKLYLRWIWLSLQKDLLSSFIET